MSVDAQGMVNFASTPTILRELCYLRMFSLKERVARHSELASDRHDTVLKTNRQVYIFV